jgi:hypothetical protein
VTIINRVCVELCDILAIRLQCKSCQSAISYLPKDWKPKALRCPHCDAIMIESSETEASELRALRLLAEGLRTLMGTKIEPRFELRLEFEQR